MGTKKPTIHWGIIGCGAVTEVKSGPALYQAEGSCVSGVFRRNIHKAHDYASRHNIEHVFTSAKALINSAYVDAVYIATPPNSHCELALQVATAGKPCCVEKPMANSYLDCQRMIAAFEKTEQALFVSYYRRSLPRFIQVQRWLESGAIGKVRQVHWQFCKPANEIDRSGQYNWRTDISIAPGGYFDDLASHGLDLIQHLLGDIKNVSGLHNNQQQLYSSADAISACWQHQDGVMGSGNWNFGASDRRDRIEIIGSAGRIEFSVFQEQPIQLFNNHGEKSLFIDNPTHIQQYHVANMLAHLNGQGQHPSTGYSAAKTSWLMAQILRQ